MSVLSNILLGILGDDTVVLHAHAAGFWAKPGAIFMVFVDKRLIRCSVAFPLIDAYGNHYFLTARRCFDPDQKGIDEHDYEAGTKNVYGVDNTGSPTKTIGVGILHPPETSTTFIDVELVKLDPSTTVTYLGSNIVPTSNPHNAVFGQQVCERGYARKNPACGMVTGVELKNKTGNLMNTSQYCDVNEDIGGPVYDSSGPVGIHVDSFGQGSGCFSGFVPLMNSFISFQQKIPTLRFAMPDQ